MNIIINRSDAIGDTLLTSPMAQMIKDRMDGARVIFIVSPKCYDLFLHHPFIDECWILDRSLSRVRRFWQLMSLFKKVRPKAYFYVGGSQLPNFVAWLLRVKIRGGLKSKLFSFFFLNKAIRQKRSMVETHESDYNLSLLTPLGIKYNYKERGSFAPQIKLLAEEKDRAWSLFNDECPVGKKEIVMIHPGMVGHTLNWSSRNYARLIPRLEASYPNRFFYIVSHTLADKKYLKDLKDELQKLDEKPSSIYFFDGSIRGLRDYMSILSRASLFVGPSTGTTHLANALGIKQIAIYSPIKVQSTFRWGPFNRDESKVRVVIPKVICGEHFHCAKESCPYYNCMAQIEVDDILEEAVSLIGEK